MQRPAGESVRARQGKLDQELLENHAGVQERASLQIQVGLQEHGGKPIDPARSKVGVLPAGFVEGEVADARDPAGLLQRSIRAARNRPAWWILCSSVVKAARSLTGCSPAASRLSRSEMASASLSPGRRVDHLPDGLDAAGLDHPGHVGPPDQAALPT